MENKKSLESILYVVLFVSTFFIIQALFQFIAIFIYAYLKEIAVNEVLQGIQMGKHSPAIIISSLLSSLVSIALFIKLKWSPISRTYLKSKPWAVLTWAGFLGLGAILPAQYIYERLQVEMAQNVAELFKGIMNETGGYLVVGILAPIGEELIFRGAVLRKLLTLFEGKKRWIAIFISAAIFGAIHGNFAQGIHATLFGMLLGWMYMRTGSVLPGIALHWVNNTVAYLMFKLLPEMNDGKLIDLFHGDERMMYGGLFFSLCILVPSIFQLALRMKKVSE